MYNMPKVYTVVIWFIAGCHSYDGGAAHTQILTLTFIDKDKAIKVVEQFSKHLPSTDSGNFTTIAWLLDD